MGSNAILKDCSSIKGIILLNRVQLNYRQGFVLTYMSITYIFSSIIKSRPNTSKLCILLDGSIEI